MNCEDCGSSDIGKTTGRVFYPHRPDLADKTIWKCKACGAYVGCRGSTDIPLGTPAGYALRGLRKQCHAKFDLMWKTGQKSRTEEEAHIGRFNTEKCRRLLAILDRQGDKMLPVDSNAEMEEAVRYILVALQKPGCTYHEIVQQFVWAYGAVELSLIPEWFLDNAQRNPDAPVNKSDRASLIYGVMVRKQLQITKAE